MSQSNRRSNYEQVIQATLMLAGFLFGAGTAL